MSFLRKFVLAASAAAFLMSLSVASSYAQPGRARWDDNNGRHRGWTQGQRNGWNRGRKQGWANRRSYRNANRRYQSRMYRNGGYGRISPAEYRRLQRQRYRIYNQRSRAYRDGYVSSRERRRLQRSYNNYRRSTYRARRSW